MRSGYGRMLSAIILVVVLDIYTPIMYVKGKLTGMIWNTWLRYLIVLNIVVVVLVIILTILNRKR